MRLYLMVHCLLICWRIAACEKGEEREEEEEEEEEEVVEGQGENSIDLEGVDLSSLPLVEVEYRNKSDCPGVQERVEYRCNQEFSFCL